MTKKIFSLATALCLGTTLVFAQTNGSNSPYSRYGFGLLNDGGQSFNKGMAGVGYSLAGGQLINGKNPASYAQIDSLTFLFDVGVSLQNANLKSNDRRVNARNTSIDYITAAFRLRRGLGMSVGFLPFSTIGYNMETSSEIVRPSGNVVQSDYYSGDGGLHNAFIGLGWRPFKNLSVGMNAGYLWGSMSHTILVSFSDANIDSRRREYQADVSTYKLDFGLQYNLRLNKKNRVGLGLTYGLGHPIDNSANYYEQRISSSSVVTADTQSVKKAFDLPHTFGAGLSWNYNNSLTVAVDYTLQKWADANYPILSSDGTVYTKDKNSFKNLHKIAAGVEYLGNPEGLYWRQRVRYRAGFAYTSPYTKMGGTDGPSSLLFSAGVGLPLSNRFTNNGRSVNPSVPVLNIAVQYEHISPRQAGFLSENYLRLSIGLTFNERWFQKWKVE